MWQAVAIVAIGAAIVLLGVVVWLWRVAVDLDRRLTLAEEYETLRYEDTRAQLVRLQLFCAQYAEQSRTFCKAILRALYQDAEAWGLHDLKLWLRESEAELEKDST